MARPVRRTDALTVASSKGARLRRSTTSTSQPSRDRAAVGDQRDVRARSANERLVDVRAGRAQPDLLLRPVPALRFQENDRVGAGDGLPQQRVRITGGG